MISFRLPQILYFPCYTLLPKYPPYSVAALSVLAACGVGRSLDAAPGKIKSLARSNYM